MNTVHDSPWQVHMPSLDEVAEVMAMYAAGLDTSSIAAELRLAEAIVYAIIFGRDRRRRRAAA